MSMANPVILWIGLIMLVFSLCIAHADFVEETLVVHNKVFWRLCESQEITVVNGSFPGPTIYAREGDSVVIHVINNSPYNMTIHWHGIFQLLSNWQDGPAFITQCPILPGNKYTYRFNIIGQEGTLFWHAHSGWHRATVHGALIVYPRKGHSYPFPKPDGEFPIIIGEWFNTSVSALENHDVMIGNNPNISQSLTINGWPGDLYPCSSRRRFLSEDPDYDSLKLSTDATNAVLDDIFRVNVKPGKTYMLRIICAALNNHAFFMIANHNLTVVAVDASYTIPYTTNMLVISPGQTIDVLITANQHPTSYYMASRYYLPLVRMDGVPADSVRHITPQTALLEYENANISTSKLPHLPNLPNLTDYESAFNFFNSFKGLQNGPHWQPVPHQVDEYMFITAGLNTVECIEEDKSKCPGPNNTTFGASFNNISFIMPTKMPILQAYYNNISGIYTNDFPSQPPTIFDFSNVSLALDTTLLLANQGTKVKKLKYNSTVEIVLQNTGLIGQESHPIHLHGFNFYVLAQDYGNYDPSNDYKKFNLENPHIRNTITIPVGGWSALRFIANNPGVWYMHCHLEIHVPMGLATVFIVEDGQTPSAQLPPPPSDLPRC